VTSLAIIELIGNSIEALPVAGIMPDKLGGGIVKQIILGLERGDWKV
jgi:hypothetical protein